MDTNPPSTGLEALQSAYRAAPESKIFAPLGDAYRRAGRFEEAVAVLDQGTARHPDYVAALVLLALCQLDLGRDADAEASLARVLALDPENLVALKSRARRALGRADWSQAEPLLELVLGIDPYDREALQLRDELRARRAAGSRAPEPAAPVLHEVPPWSSPPEAPPLPHVEPVASPAPERRASPPPVPSPATSDAEWDVQRDADRIVIRPRSQAEPLPTPADEFSTLTLARIYESQGLAEKAVAIYEQLQRQQPENAEVAARLQALRARLLAAVEGAPAPAAPGTTAAAPTWRLLDAETLAASPEEAAEQLRELTDSVRDREFGRRHTQIGQGSATAPTAPAPPVPQDEPDFERFLRYVRSLKHTR